MLPLRDATPPARTPVVTAAVLAACAALFGYELVLELAGTGALVRFVFGWGLVPADLAAALAAGDIATKPVLGLVTHLFLHGGWLHLLGNGLFLGIFAPRVEGRLGRLRFLAFYLAGGVAAALGQTLSDPTGSAPMIGASGAISAVLGGYLVLFPRARVQSLVFLGFYYDLVAVPAGLLLGFWFALQLIDGVASLGLGAGAAGGIAIWAHVAGFAAGALLAVPVRFLGRPAPGPAGSHAVSAPPGPPPPPAFG